VVRLFNLWVSLRVHWRGARAIAAPLPSLLTRRPAAVAILNAPSAVPKLPRVGATKKGAPPPPPNQVGVCQAGGLSIDHQVPKGAYFIASHAAANGDSRRCRRYFAEAFSPRSLAAELVWLRANPSLLSLSRNSMIGTSVANPHLWAGRAGVDRFIESCLLWITAGRLRGPLMQTPDHESQPPAHLQDGWKSTGDGRLCRWIRLKQRGPITAAMNRALLEPARPAVCCFLTTTSSLAWVAARPRWRLTATGLGALLRAGVLQPLAPGTSSDAKLRAPFRFNSLHTPPVREFMGGYTSPFQTPNGARSGAALIENLCGVAYRSEAELAYRWRQAGLEYSLYSEALIDHLQLQRGARSYGQHLQNSA